MSTRSTLGHDEGHHLFVDFAEPRTVFLTLDGADFEARPGSVTVAIPLELWDRLRVVRIDPDVYWDEEDGRDDPETRSRA